VGEAKTVSVLAVGRDHKTLIYGTLQMFVELTVPIWKQNKWCKEIGVFHFEFHIIKYITKLERKTNDEKIFCK
jgi:hypothetical protein